MMYVVRRKMPAAQGGAFDGWQGGAGDNAIFQTQVAANDEREALDEGAAILGVDPSQCEVQAVDSMAGVGTNIDWSKPLPTKGELLGHE